MKICANQTLLIVLCFLWVTSCAIVTKSNQQIKIDKFSRYSLQPVPKGLQGRETMQKLSITSTKGKHELLVQTELLSDQINMVGFSSSGLVLFQLQWNALADIEVATSIKIDGLEPAVLLAYYQLSNWPLESIAIGLEGMEAKISPGNPNIRQYFHQQELVFNVTTQEHMSVLEHFRDKYSIEIEFLETNFGPIKN